MKRPNILLIIVSVLLVTACKKNSGGVNNPAPPTCRIHTIKSQTGNITATYKFKYNELNLLTEIVHDNGTGGSVTRIITYPYAAPCEVTTMSGSNWLSKLYNTLWGDGTLRHVTAMFNTPGSLPVTTDYAHDNFGHLFSITIMNQTVMQTTLFKWDANDNMIEMLGESGGDTTHYEYDLNKVYSPGHVDPLSRSLVNSDGLGWVRLYGAPAYNPRNLLKSKQNGNYPKTNFTYDFDADGKIVRSTASNGTTITVSTYEYACD